LILARRASSFVAITASSILSSLLLFLPLFFFLRYDDDEKGDDGVAVSGVECWGSVEGSEWGGEGFGTGGWADDRIDFTCV
jgi:hypothetical protein